MQEFWQQFLSDLKQTGWIEYIAVVAGIASVWFSRIENILVYPVGLINTTFYIYISINGDLYGEAGVNLYYTIMSIYGWALWARRDRSSHQHVVRITQSDTKEWLRQIGFFAFFSIKSCRYLTVSAG